jgi:hypothetical protein
MAELVARIDCQSVSQVFFLLTSDIDALETAPLSTHLDAHNVEFMQFAFRWMNCLLMREISVQNTIRMWDTYLVRIGASFPARVLLICWCGQAEGPDAFSQFHLYVCSAFLVKWSEKLRQMDFQVRPSPLYALCVTLIDHQGHHHVPPISPHAKLGRSRDRNVAQRGVRAQHHLAQRAKPF